MINVVSFNRCKRQSNCLVCGSKIPLLRHMTISLYIGAECPSCHSYMTFSKRIFALQFLIQVMIFPALKMIFVEESYFLGGAALLALMFAVFFVSYTAKYIVDPAHRSRMKR